ncbi:MAG: bifunctional 1-(5-phosphoribosyl)-5-((5-phosphoribosylamino)methylideneamino)imidazole-4-carboxamide isomerase/phosphoribosylanthranilate isomerase PriA [Gemmatimonadetes bacterium]|nr:bifunctional 1-(5-phosphoribosyl)-5-((5-phosphoribosylamino)methylideneamino)imidazole-4-carboxamide isomerase/phosphoribosylanthranilate isomerase PriA [Gemmatimonadota bacterium]
MDLYPAVDVQGGRMARVPPGHPDDPLAVARAFAAAGARWVHFVDLDRAYGRGDNRALARRFLADADLRVQVGGGLATEEAITEMLDWGAARVVVGAAAAADAARLTRLLSRHGAERVAVAIDAKGGRLVPRGAAGTGALDLTVAELARRVRAQGIHTVVYTDVTRDGALAGPDVDGARAIAALGLDVVASGGVASLEDLARVRAAGLAGAVVGRALYEGRFTLAQALACLTA